MIPVNAWEGQLSNEIKVIVLKPGQGKKVDRPSGVQTMKVAGEEVNGSFGLWESEISGGPGPHIHHKEEEAFYVLAGEVMFRAGGQQQLGRPGTFLHVPRGVPHHFKNESTEPARLLIWFSPAGIEVMMEKMAADPDNYKAIGMEYGVEFVEEV